MKKLLFIAALLIITFESAFAAMPLNNQVLIDTPKKIMSIKPMRMRRDTMVKKPMKKDTTRKM